MNKTLQCLLSTTLVFLASCGGSNSGVGTWQFDADATIEINMATIQAEMDADQDGMAEAMKEMVLGIMVATFKQTEYTLTLNEDGSLTMLRKTPVITFGTQNVQRSAGTWTAASSTGTWTAAGSTLTLTSKEDGSNKEETQTATVDGDSLTSVIKDNGHEMTFIFNRQ